MVCKSNPTKRASEASGCGESLTGMVHDAEPDSVSEVACSTRASSPCAAKTIRDWEAEVQDAYNSGRYAYHRLSRVLYEAKRPVPYGEWTALWDKEDRLFAVRKADKLAFVGQNPTSLVPLDRAETCLPTALNTLNVLAHLPHRLLLDLIDAGTIHPKLKRKQAEALLDKFDVSQEAKPPVLNSRRVVARILRHVRQIRVKAPHDFAWALRKLQRALDQAALRTTSESISQPQAEKAA